MLRSKTKLQKTMEKDCASMPMLLVILTLIVDLIGAAIVIACFFSYWKICLVRFAVRLTNYFILIRLAMPRDLRHSLDGRYGIFFSRSESHIHIIFVGIYTIFSSINVSLAKLIGSWKKEKKNLQIWIICSHIWIIQKNRSWQTKNLLR